MVSIRLDGGGERAAGVIQNFGSRSARSDQKKNPQREIDPHDKQHQHAGKPRQRTAVQVVGVTNIPACTRRVTTNTHDSNTIK